MRKYILGFSQKEAVELGVTVDELVILRYFIDFKDTGSMVEEYLNGKTYHWLLYKKVLEDLPILNIKTIKSLTRKLDALVEAKLLDKYILKKSSGTKTYFRIGENYKALVKESDLIIPVEKEAETDITPYKEIIEYLNDKTGSSFNHKGNDNRKLIKARWNEGNRLEDFKRVIDNMCILWENEVWNRNCETIEAKTFLRPKTLFGNNFDDYKNKSVNIQKEPESIMDLVNKKRQSGAYD